MTPNEFHDLLVCEIAFAPTQEWKSSDVWPCVSAHAQPETQTSLWNAFVSPRHAGGPEGSTPSFHQSADDLKCEETFASKRTKAERN